MSNELTFRIIFIVLFATVFLAGFRYRWRAQQAGKRAGDRLSRKEEGAAILIPLRLFGLVLWLSAFAYMINPQWVVWAQLALPDAVRWLGVIVGVAVTPIVYWVTISLGNNVTDTIAIRKEHRLVTTGPYRWVRHPLYTFGFVLFLALTLISANGLMGLALAAGLPLIVIRTPKEEAMLIARFGDEYRVYMQRTGRYLPRLIL